MFMSLARFGIEPPTYDLCHIYCLCVGVFLL
jgi:hypothetical protein